MSPIQDFTLNYETVNMHGTISEGDTLTGTVSFTLKKETKVKSLVVKVKGDLDVRYTKRSLLEKKTLSAKTRYFKIKKYLLAENSEGTVLPQGPYCFEFNIEIPDGNLPSSFRGAHGKIVYAVEAKLSRSWRWPTSKKRGINFVSKSLLLPSLFLRGPQTDSVTKEVGVFSKGQVEMSVTLDRKVCFPGDTLSVVAKIRNLSKKEMRCKFSLHRKTVYNILSEKKINKKNLFRAVGETLRTNSEKTVSCQMKIPDDVIPTLCNCDIITVGYYVKVYLDISFAFDPEVRFPLIIVPSSFASLYPGGALEHYPTGAVGGPSYSDFPAPAFPPGPGPSSAPAGPSPYGYPAADPTLHAYTLSGYNNPYGFPSAPVHSPSVPPSYTSIYPTPNDGYRSSWSKKH